VILRPGIPTELEWCQASYRSLYGTIESRWKQADHNLTWEICIPPNTTGTVCVPLRSGAQTIQEGGQTVWDAGKPDHLSAGLKFLRAETGYVVFAAGAGKYAFTVK
jgi:alpha-L-rhamnosidase